MERKLQGPQPIVFLSKDTKLIAAVSERLVTAGIEIVALPTVDALTADRCPGLGAILVLDTKTLPEGQDIASLMGHVERRWGSRPMLTCIAHSSAIELRLQALRAGADAFWTSPVAADELAARLLALSDTPGSDGYRILVVDDQPVAVNFAVRVLEDAGMRTHSVGDPRRVLEILEAFRPDLVLMDLHMPGVDGIELTALIREHEAVYATPVVFLSSELDPSRQLDTLRVGGNDFIAKPVHPEQLVATVRRNIRTFRRRQGRQHPSGGDTPSLLTRTEKVRSKSGEPADNQVGSQVGSNRPPAPADPNPERVAQLTALVQAALRSAGLQLVYQPIMALRGERKALYETGLRLKLPDGEYLPASAFLPAARQGGLLPAIDRWVMEHALDRLRQEQATHPRLRLFLHQGLETLNAEEWLPWFRNRIAAWNLIETLPILQFQFAELSAAREVAATRFEALRHLAIETCLDVPADDPQVTDLIDDLGIALIRFPLPPTRAPDPARLTELVTRVHAVGAKVIVAHIQDPRTIARVFGCGVDFIQGDFLHPPSAELDFDFGEAALA
ncbi:response regulator [Candidatus Thiosymbion oneisti]|uniref:response regulator n=1 Tax=Candidatus Thiosymbion oneisti TaxID=589554 RepID=UPI000B7CEDF0|nr:response regulator [Candidatus Thiosymbion oneisti]